MAEIKGIITALITPFLPDSKLDENGLKILIGRQVENGVNGIAVAAGSGEFVNLSDDERSRIVEISVNEARGRVAVIAGVFSPNTRDAANWAKKAAALGADALLVLTPMYNKPSMDGLIGHFRTIAESANLPILIYNNAGRTGINLSPDDYIKLSDISKIIGIKECNRDLGTFTQTISMLKSQWNSILCGDDDILYLALELGAKGGIITTSNIFPSRWVSMYKAIVKGDHETAKAIHYEIQPFFQAIYTFNHPALIKKTLSLLGLPAGSTRAPLADATKEQEQRLRSLISEMKLTK